MEPIKKQDIAKFKKNTIPSEVIEVFNVMIAEKWNGKYSIIKLKNAAVLIARNMDISLEDVYKRGYLDVEDIFRDAGWKVEFDRPGYCETYDANFTFS